jgi:hypothetical protein
MTSQKYRLFKLTSHGRFLVVENADGLLSPYRCLEPIGTPFAGVRLGVGSILLLGDETASVMLTKGGIETLEAIPLRYWRDVEAERQAARYETRKLSRDTVEKPGG